MSKIVIYHAFREIVDKPKIIKGEFTKDFGSGFYCTVLKEQAVKWTKKFDKRIVSKYEYHEIDYLKVKEFSTMSDEWLDFIANSRSGKKHEYDIVIGPMADDQVYNYVNDYISGLITREAFWELSKFKYPTHQIVFCTEEALKAISFIGYEEY